MEDHRLQELRAVLSRLLETKRAAVCFDELRIENNSDELDQVQSAMNREMAVFRLERNFDRLRAVKAALVRIEEGVYGACVRCDAEISTKRLLAVPWTPYCLACQEEVDAGQEPAAQTSDMQAA